MQDHLKVGHITMRHVSSHLQLADIFTKALSCNHFLSLHGKLCIWDIHALIWGRVLKIKILNYVIYVSFYLVFILSLSTITHFRQDSILPTIYLNVIVLSEFNWGIAQISRQLTGHEVFAIATSWQRHTAATQLMMQVRAHAMQRAMEESESYRH